MKSLAALAGLLALVACASPTPEAPRASPPLPLPPPAIPIASPLPPAKDACGAAELQSLLGHPRTEIPVPVEPNRQRVACTTCPVTEDFRPDRLNFFFDAATGAIREIKCG